MKNFPIKITMTNNEEIIAIVRGKIEFWNDDPLNFPKFELWRMSSIINSGTIYGNEYYIDNEFEMDLPPNTMINGSHILKIDTYPEFNDLLATLQGEQTNEDWLKEKIRSITKDIQNEKADNV